MSPPRSPEAPSSLTCVILQAIHKALEREIHPATVPVPTHSREDVWGVRLLNMFAGLEALLSPRGVCRELPVVGFVRGVMVVGVIVSSVQEA